VITVHSINPRLSRWICDLSNSSYLSICIAFSISLHLKSSYLLISKKCAQYTKKDDHREYTRGAILLHNVTTYVPYKQHRSYNPNYYHKICQDINGNWFKKLTTDACATDVWIVHLLNIKVIKIIYNQSCINRST
jgi:hypothetical protein